MDVSVITVTWNSEAFIADQLSSVQAGCSGVTFEQLVVDNASTDNTAAIIKEKFSQVKLFAENKNLGFGAGNNLAASHSAGRYFLLINPDMRVAPGAISKIIAWADAHPKAGIVGIKLTKPSGEVNLNTSPRRFPRLQDEIILNLKFAILFPSLLKRYMARDLDLQKEQVVDSVQGSFMLVRRELYEKLGHLFDPRYFIWFEDVDLCREAKKLGYEVWYTPVATCVDYGSQSFKLRRPLWKQNAFIKSQITYFDKWGPRHARLVLSLIKPFSLAIAAVHSLIV